MIQLRNRTEFSFNYAVGRMASVLAQQKAHVAGIADRGSTWGHVRWAKACKEKGIKPIFGVELAIVENPLLKERQPTAHMTFLARSSAGLTELYRLVTFASGQFYFEPRLGYE